MAWRDIAPLMIASAVTLWSCDALLGLSNVKDGEAVSAATGAGGAGASTASSTSNGGAGATPSSTSPSQGGGGAGGSTIGEVVACGGLADDFDGSALGPNWLSPWGTVTVNNGLLIIAPDMDAVPDDNGLSMPVIDHRDCAVWVEVQSVLTQAVQSYTMLIVGQQGDRAIIGVNQGKLYFLVDETIKNNGAGGAGGASGVGGSGGSTSVSTFYEDGLSYDPSVHRWWRIREETGTTSFETSPNGVAWLRHHQIASPAFMSSSTVGMHANVNASTPVPGKAEFDNFGVAP